MAEDYSKLTVLQIRERFKNRGIPATGLTRKQQLIDKLLEEDAKAEHVVQPDTANDEVANSENVAEAAANEDSPAQLETSTTEQAPEKVEEKQSENPPEISTEHITPAVQEESIRADSKISEPLPPTLDTNNANAAESISAPLTQMVDKSHSELQSASPTRQQASSPISDEGRKRKRRSLTPEVTQEDAAALKRRKVEDGADAHEEQMQVDEVSIEGVRDTDGKVDGTSRNSLENSRQHETQGGISDVQKSAEKDVEMAEDHEQRPEKDTGVGNGRDSQHHKSVEPHTAPPRSRYREIMEPPEPERPVQMQTRTYSTTPSRHSATSALYIGNLKRPLRPDALREYIDSLAQPPPDSDQNKAVLETFYVDNIRSHCFAIFSVQSSSSLSTGSTDAAISAAIRVREAMHDTQFPPGETHRDPLLVDFVPTLQVSEWIEKERDHAGGPRGSGKRWEVIYTGMYGESEAVHREVTSTTALPGQRSAPLSNIKDLAETNRTKGFKQESEHPEKPRSQAFLALDKLFSCTKARPSLYFLPVKPEIATTRLDMLDSKTSRDFKGLDDREPKRRFTFEPMNRPDESYNGPARNEPEMLVDNGPEFGMFGTRGGRRGGRGGRGWRP